MPKGSKEQPAASKFVSNHTHYSTTDGDATISVKPGKPRQLNYHAQVAVDTAHHVITQIQSDHANKKDSQCLPSLLSNTINNLKAEDLQVEEVLADAGYSSGEALQALEDNNIEGYIPPTLASTKQAEKVLLMINKTTAIPAAVACTYLLRNLPLPALVTR